MPNSARNISCFDKSEIKKLFKQARRLLKLPGLDILVHPQLQGFGRILVITPAKIGNAVQRNRIRRQLKALFYTQKYPEKAFDYIIIIKKEGIAYSFEQLRDALSQAYSKAPDVFHA
jgi:ribonuclease P protein component